MEQKTLLAIVLSVAVLFSYETFFVGPQRAKAKNNSQVVVNKEFTASSNQATPASAKLDSKPTNINFTENKWDLKTTAFNTSISNVGGSIHNIDIKNQHPLPLTDLFNIKGFENEDFKLISKNASKSIYSFSNGLSKITKTYEIQDENTLKVRMDIVSLTSDKLMSRLDNIEFILIAIDSTHLNVENKREVMLDEYSVLVDQKIIRKGNAAKFNAKENRIIPGQLQWAGFREHYSTVIIHPEFKTKSIEINTVTENNLNISVKPELVSSTGVYEFVLYAGKQDINLMKKYNVQFEKIVAFFNWKGMDILAKGIYYTIPFLHSIFKSWGISIILISLIIYGLTYPLTVKSMMSMRRMQQMQPKIKALQERYKSDPKKLNEEVMNIYKVEKINPLGGCLPFLLQMPIFIGLYQVLWRSSYFQGQGFLWIKDLALPDRLFIMPFTIPFLGNEFNILPILMGIVMFFQQKVSSKNIVITDEQQAMQQKMMMYFFPVFIGFIFYKFASGLSLYFTVFYLLSTLTQLKMSKAK